MTTLRLLALLLLALEGTNSFAADFFAGICDARSARERHTIRYNVEQRNDSDSFLTVKQTCTKNNVQVKKCAVIVVRNTKVQRWCYPGDRQPYFEFSDVIEYWGAPSAGGDSK